MTYSLKFLILLVLLLTGINHLTGNNSLQEKIDNTLKIFSEGIEISGKSVTIEGKETDSELKAFLSISNPSGSSVSVKVRKTEVKMVNGTQNSFCFGECYPPEVYESNPFKLEAGQSTVKGVFYLEYFPNNFRGTSEIKYEVFDVNNRSNSTSVTVYFAAPLTSAIAMKNNTLHTVMVYPNPATGNQVFIQYSLPLQLYSANFEVNNAHGNVIFKTLLTKQEMTIPFNISGLSDGVYYIRLSGKNSQIISARFIIRRQNH